MALNLLQLGSYFNPDNFSFELPGPGTIPLKLRSEPNLTINLSIFNRSQVQTKLYSLTTNAEGYATFLLDLTLGQYEIISEVRDLAGNPTTLPTIHLHLFPQFIIPSIPLPAPFAPTPPISIPPPSSLPATAQLIASRVREANIYYITLAVIIVILLITRRKYNLRVLDNMGKPLAHLSITDTNAKTYHTNAQGYVYIPQLSTRKYLLLHTTPTSTSLCLYQPLAKVITLIIS